MDKQVTPQSRSLEDWLCFLEQQHPSEIDLGLARISQVAERGALQQQSAKVITVAGTNGKGTTCALLEQLLQAAGYRVGVFSSPHISDYRERVRIDGVSPSAEAFCESFAQVEALTEEISLTYFEYSALSALWLFKQQPLDFVILEVGLGGRLDATNIVSPDLAVVTTVALDHVDWLGDDIAQIGREKAGIFRENAKVVIGDPKIVSSVVEQAELLNCDSMLAGAGYLQQLEAGCWHYQGRELSYAKLPLTKLPLVNAATALACLEQLGLNLEQDLVCQVLSAWSVPGRMQVLNQSPLIILDVAHNPQSAEHLASQLQQMPEYRWQAVCAMLGDKDVANSVAPLRECIEQWHISGLSGWRGNKGEQLQQALSGQSVVKYDTVLDAYCAAKQHLAANDALIVFGSFYTVAEILESEATRT